MANIGQGVQALIAAQLAPVGALALLSRAQLLERASRTAAAAMLFVLGQVDAGALAAGLVERARGLAPASRAHLACAAARAAFAAVGGVGG